jgi:flavin-dependent dehydrogenase
VTPLETPAALLPSAVDVAIIGAGPAGSTSAALLKKQGYSVVIVEAQRFPRFVIGESLLARCMDHLDEAGMLEAVRARDYLVKRGALFLRDGERADIDFSEQFTKGWTWTWQVPRADFDTTLANCAVEQGVPLFYNHTVTGIELGPPNVLTVRTPAGEDRRITARFVIDASGYGRVLPRLLDLEKPSTLPPRKALFSHVRGDRRPEGTDQNRIWICMHPDPTQPSRSDAWIWIIPFSDGITSVGVVSDVAFFERYSGTDEEILRQILSEDVNARDRLKDMELLWEPRIIQGYSASVKQLSGPGYALVGNATEFLDPVFSSGVTLALESANRAAHLVARELRGESINWTTEYAGYMSRGIEAFRCFVEGWYTGEFPTVLFAPNPSPLIRKQITSVLAGYVWDEENPFVRTPVRRLHQVLHLIQHEAGAK